MQHMTCGTIEPLVV